MKQPFNRSLATVSLLTAKLCLAFPNLLSLISKLVMIGSIGVGCDCPKAPPFAGADLSIPMKVAFPKELPPTFQRLGEVAAKGRRKGSSHEVRPTTYRSVALLLYALLPQSLVPSIPSPLSLISNL